MVLTAGIEPRQMHADVFELRRPRKKGPALGPTRGQVRPHTRAPNSNVRTSDSNSIQREIRYQIRALISHSHGWVPVRGDGQFNAH